MSKYEVGDKIILTVTGTEEAVCHPYYVLNDNSLNILVSSIDKYAEPLTAYTEPLETKIENLKKKLKRWVEKCTNQSAEITRLLAENEKLKAENGNVIWEIEQAFDRGCNEAWELARKIVLKNGYSAYDLHEIFNCCGSHQALEDYTYPEAAAKVAEWEKGKEEIKVGDVLEDIADRSVKCVATSLYPNNMAYLVFDDGSAGMNHLDHFKKTGRHIDIDGFLKQIGGKQE